MAALDADVASRPQFGEVALGAALSCPERKPEASTWHRGELPALAALKAGSGRKICERDHGAIAQIFPRLGNAIIDDGKGSAHGFAAASNSARRVFVAVGSRRQSFNIRKQCAARKSPHICTEMNGRRNTPRLHPSVQCCCIDWPVAA